MKKLKFIKDIVDKASEHALAYYECYECSTAFKCRKDYAEREICPTPKCDECQLRYYFINRFTYKYYPLENIQFEDFSQYSFIEETMPHVTKGFLIRNMVVYYHPHNSFYVCRAYGKTIKLTPYVNDTHNEYLNRLAIG